MPPSFSTPDDQQDRNFKAALYTFVTGLLFLVLVGRLFYLQYFEYDENLRLSENNRMRKKIVKAERGNIFDRNNQVLVRNRPSYQISILPYKVENSKELFDKLMFIRDTAGQRLFDSAHVAWTLERGKWRRFRPLRILEDASIEQVSLIEEHQEELPGVVTVIESRRDYPHGTMAAHVLGYTGEVTEEQLELEEYSTYSFGDRLGKKGLERQYQEFFRGENGIKYYEVNAYGREIGLLEDMPHQEPTPGHHIITTLDLELQKVAEAAFPDSLKGAVVALNPQTGEIYLTASSPRIDPNIFSLEKKELAREWANVALDSDRPLNNRAVVGTYPPGSVFKMLTGIAGLESGAITPTSKKYKACTGGYRFGRRYQRCWLSRGHGRMDLIDALRESCDVYFYQLGLEIGMDEINRVGRAYGLGTKTGVDLPIEKNGLLMDSVTYNKRFGHKGWRWSRGQILNLSIGQGELVTPLQIASMWGAVALNKGVYRPHYLKEVRDTEGNIIKKYKPELNHKHILSPEHYAAAIEAMEQVISAPGGTGGRARVPGVRVGGKTGSAENPHGEKTHAWFAAVAPLEDPVIAIAVVVENAGHGGSVAAPIAGKVLNHFFRGQRSGNSGH
jgi:penicillin-binding protein 2